MIFSAFSKIQMTGLWLCGTVFAMLLIPSIGTAQAKDHPMQKHGYFVAAENLYVPPKPDRLPALVPGQQFICIPDSQQSLLYHDAASGRLLPRSDLALKVLTLAKVENKSGSKSALRFVLEGSGRNVLLSTSENDVTKLPGLQPLVQDDTLRRLQKKYVGKKTWVYGSVQALSLTIQPNTGASFDFDNSQPIVIQRLVRVYKRQAGGVDVVTSNPLIAVLDVPANAHWRSATFMGTPNFAAQAEASPHTVCLGFWSNHVDDWDFERTFSLVNMYRVHPRWPHQIRLGMTPDMVAWIKGWPPVYGTMAQLRKESKWQYPTEAIFSYWVYFKNGKVVKFGADGHLP